MRKTVIPAPSVCIAAAFQTQQVQEQAQPRKPKDTKR